MKINQIIKNIREYRGYSQAEFANMCGKSRSAMNVIENGSHSIRPYTLKKLADTLNVTTSEIYNIKSIVNGNHKQFYSVLCMNVVDFINQKSV